MNDIARLGLEIYSDSVPRATDRLHAFEGQAVRTERSSNMLAGAMRALAPAVAAVTAALSVRALTGYADAWSDMQSRVGAAVKDMQAAPELMQRMVDIANASYSPLEQTVDVYSRNVAVLDDLGYAAQGAADFTEALNHALVITATRGQRAASVQEQLSKAMAVGTLQADGLETVLANGGRIAEALADELGTTVSGLRALSSQGQITGDVIARALTGRLAELRSEAAEMPATIEDGFTRIRNNLTAYVGQVDQAIGASQRFAEMLLDMADGITGLTGPTIALAENFDGLIRAASVVALAAIARQLVIMGNSAVEYAQKQITAVQATREAAVVEQQAAASRLRSAEAAMAVARANGLLTASYTSVSRELLAARMNMTAANAALEATTLRARAATIAMTGLRNVLAFFGGWVGVAFTAITAGLALWATRADDASRALEVHEGIVQSLRGAYNDAGGAAAGWADEIARGSMTQAIVALRDLQGQFDNTVSSMTGFGGAMRNQFPSIANLTDMLGSGAITLDEFKQRLDAIGQESEGNLQTFAAHFLNMADAALKAEGNVKAAEAAIRVMNGTATQADMILLGLASAANTAASGFRNAASGASEYASALATIGSMIPRIAEQQREREQYVKLTEAASAAEQDLNRQWLAGTLDMAGYNARMAETNALVDEAYNNITGLTAAQEALSGVERQAAIDALPAKEAALARVTDRYADLEEQLLSAGASEDELTRLTAAMNQELANTAARFDQVAGSGGGGGGGTIQAAQERMEQLQSDLEAIQQLYATEHELLLTQFEERASVIEQARAAELISQAEFNELRLNLERDYAQQVAAIQASQYAGALSAAGNFFGALANTMGQENEAMLKVQKTFAAASALVNAWLAASQALADPTVPFWGKFAAVASVVTAGLGIVNAITSGSTSPGSARSGGGGGASSTPAAPQQAQRETVINLTLGGNGRYSRDDIRDLFDQMTDELDDGVGTKFKLAVNQ